MQEFIANPNRDASATIAGFVYQVDLTILHWLNLQSGELLELERGEDIDVIQDWISVGDLRTLEQVKHRSSNLTLSTPEALIAVANFCEHKANNPGQRLGFRYLTTSRTGKEKSWQLSGTAIEAWEALRRGTLSAESRAEVVSGIRTFLLGCSKPNSLTPKTWRCLQSLLAKDGDERLVEIIENFEWSTSAGDDSVKESEIKRALLKSEYASDETGANALFERLFLYVFRKLTQKGLKRLTPGELVEQLTLPPLTGADRHIFVILGVVRLLNARLDALEQRFSQEHELVTALGAHVALLMNDQGAPIKVEYRDPVVSFDTPTLVRPAIPRTGAVDQIAAGFSHVTWVHIVGEPGLGKTQLCVLASHRFSSGSFWISLRDCTEDNACAILDGSLEAVSGIGRHLMLRDWYKRAASQLKGSLIIIDDLPTMFSGGRLTQRMEFLRAACVAHEIRLLTASYYQLPSTLIEAGSTQEISAPKLTNAEIGELLAQHGAPASFLNDKFAEFLSTLTQRLTVLVAAVARFLASRDWNVEFSSLTSLLQGEFAKGIRQDAERIIHATVPDDDSRELLYRLRLAVGSFSRLDVEAISRVPKPINLGFEKLKGLNGLWIQEYEQGRYQVSALLDSSLADYLNSETRRGVHAALAFRVLSNKSLNQVDVFNAFYHFVGADLLHQAVLVLIQALLSLTDRKGVIDDGGISEIWAHSPLPGQVDINLRLFLRALQIRTFYTRGKEVSYLLQDFETLALQSDADQHWGIFMAASFLAIAFAYSKPPWANRYLLMALRSGAGDTIPLPDGRQIRIPEKARLETALWITANRSTSDEDVEDWLTTISQLTSEQIGRLKQSDLADNAVVLCDCIWLREYRKPQSVRDWDRVEGLLGAVETCARKIDFPLLRAAAIRTQIVILADDPAKLNEARERAEAALAEAQTDDERFLLLEVTGRQLAYADQWTQAIKWLRDALAARGASPDS